MGFSGTSLDRNLRRSLAWKTSQREVADLITSSYEASTIREWQKMRDDFDRDSSKPNPYEEIENRTNPSILNLTCF
jgi:hypothetical protein